MKKYGLLNEFIKNYSIEGLLAERPSGESQESFRKWLAKRSKRPINLFIGTAC